MLDSYCLKEMEEKGWIRLKDKKSFTQKYMDLIEFLNVKDISTFDSYLDKRFLFKKKDNSNNIKIYLWTGYVYEDLLEKHEKILQNILSEIDVLIDGPFIKEQRDITLEMRGSRNQRIIDLKENK